MYSRVRHVLRLPHLRPQLIYGSGLATAALALALLGLVGPTPLLSQPVAAQTGGDPLVWDWSSIDTRDTTSVAWGDYDGDGDLDLVLGNDDEPNQLYRNDGLDEDNIPRFILAWSSGAAGRTTSIAWGDYDRDGDLDLAVGNACGEAPQTCRALTVYRNDQGQLTLTVTWSSSERDDARSIAWGDYDGDGYLDLAVGSGCRRLPPYTCYANRVYRNDPTASNPDKRFKLTWSSDEREYTTSIAWGDVDGDGDLDLAVGNSCLEELVQGSQVCHPSRVYRNVASAVIPLERSFTRAWMSPTAERTYSVAWGDVDRDGDLDLAVANGCSRFSPNTCYPNRVYRNDGLQSDTAQQLIPAWEGVKQGDTVKDDTRSVAWGDYDGDGDLDLAVGNSGQAKRLYRNDTPRSGPNPQLTLVSSFSAGDNTSSVTWTDYDGDGDLDLALGNRGHPSRLYQNTRVPLGAAQAWTPSSLTVTSLAWGDYDNDGDLDLAVGRRWSASQVYCNCGLTADGKPSLEPVWSVPDDQGIDISRLLWGDYDGDGNLDLLVANNSFRHYLYRNLGSSANAAPRFEQAWQPPRERGEASGNAAWGDYDGDGHLDLALARALLPVQVYRYNPVAVTPTPPFTLTWSSPRTGDTSTSEWDGHRSIAWGDYDGDGDLDLAVGSLCGFGNTNCRSLRLYRNEATALQGTQPFTLSWSSEETDDTTSVGWADYDGDGDLDLATGNNGQPNRLYRNDGIGLHGAARFTLVWSSFEIGAGGNIAWSDYDGDADLDLVVDGRLYRNDQGRLTPRAVWSAPATTDAVYAAWADVDGDGDLDLAVNRWLYLNTRDALSSVGARPVVSLARPAPPGNADFYSASTIHVGPIVSIPYTLTHLASLPVGAVTGTFSLDGGGRWRPALAPTDPLTTPHATSPTGQPYTYHWDIWRSGVMGRNDNVVLRLLALPDLSPRPNAIAGPFLYSAYASQTFPFRVRGTQVQVSRETPTGLQPVTGAQVYRLRAGDIRGATSLADHTGKSFATDGQGYLQGRGELRPGDRVVALQPVEYTDFYTLYHTSAHPIEAGLAIPPITSTGVQTLTVTPDNPLLLFNLDVSLEWDARADRRFMDQLTFDLKRASEFLYDWTNGQAALGRLRIYQAKDHWDEAHIRVYASNRLRPNAVQGGIVTRPITDMVTLTPPTSPITATRTLTYTPGQVRMGAIWTRYGDPGGALGEDWPRALAHELGHFAFFLDDNYLGLRGDRRLIQVDGCPGAMSDPYRTDYYSEFATTASWNSACAMTLSHQTTGRSDWATVERFYPALHAPVEPISQTNQGPTVLPLAVTQVVEQPVSGPLPLEVPIAFLVDEHGQSVLSGPNARAFLFEQAPMPGKGRLIDLGRPTLDQVRARGGRAGDQVCVYELEAQRLGCQTLTVGSQPLTLTRLTPADNWLPEVNVTPSNSTTIQLSVSLTQTLPAGLALHARLYPMDASPSRPLSDTLPITLTAQTETGRYIGELHLRQPAPEGYLHLWVSGGDSRREVVTEYALGGGPGKHWSDGVPRGRQVRVLAHDAPVISPDGQVTLWAEDHQLGQDALVALQPVTRLPAALAWATVVGQAYRLTATGPLSGTLIFNYLGSDVPLGEEQWLKVYFRPDGGEWRQLPTATDPDHNVASALIEGQGVYALMHSVEVSLRETGWNIFSYPLATPGRVPDVLASIEGEYNAVYGYDPRHADNPWLLYTPHAPPWVNSLHALSQGQVYWIHTTKPLTLYLRRDASPRAPTAAKTDLFGYPPATYYGSVLASPGFTPLEGKTVEAFVDNQACGTGRTLKVENEVKYVVHVLAAPPGSTLCGAPGRHVTFKVDQQAMAVVTPWDNNRLHPLDLRADWPFQVYLPLLTRLSP